jgi:hypothetical protein
MSSNQQTLSRLRDTCQHTRRRLDFMGQLALWMLHMSSVNALGLLLPTFTKAQSFLELLERTISHETIDAVS